MGVLGAAIAMAKVAAKTENARRERNGLPSLEEDALDVAKTAAKIGGGYAKKGARGTVKAAKKTAKVTKKVAKSAAKKFSRRFK